MQREEAFNFFQEAWSSSYKRSPCPEQNDIAFEQQDGFMQMTYEFPDGRQKQRVRVNISTGTIVQNRLIVDFSSAAITDGLSF